MTVQAGDRQPEPAGADPAPARWLCQPESATPQAGGAGVVGNRSWPYVWITLADRLAVHVGRPAGRRRLAVGFICIVTIRTSVGSRRGDPCRPWSAAPSAGPPRTGTCWRQPIHGPRPVGPPSDAS